MNLKERIIQSFLIAGLNAEIATPRVHCRFRKIGSLAVKRTELSKIDPRKEIGPRLKNSTQGEAFYFC